MRAHSPPRTSVRVVRALLAVVVGVGCLVGCNAVRAAGKVTIVGPWVGDEERNFRRVLAGRFGEDDYDYRGSRAPGQVLLADLQKGSPPDIVILPSLGELAGYVRGGAVRSLDDVIDAKDQEAYKSLWMPALTTPEESQPHRYWLPVKANLKSLIWYEPNDTSKPEDWQRAAQLPWCIGLADPPGSGWPGSDWIEDILLHQAGPEAYTAWATGTTRGEWSGEWDSPEMTLAWQTWGQLRDRVPGGPAAMLLTEWNRAGGQLQSKDCALYHQASFAQTQLESTVAFAPFPPLTAAGGPPGQFWEVSVDVAALFTDSPSAEAMLRYLATKDAQAIWPKDEGSGAYSVNSAVSLDELYAGRPVGREIAETLTGPAVKCLDAADIMPAATRDAFYRAVLEFVEDPGRLPEILARLKRVSEANPPVWGPTYPVCS